jgi:uncharacterized damage-inducible protein DinB
MELADYLRHRAVSSHRELIRALEGVTEHEAGAGSDPGWKRHRWGTGLDGSIAGIVHHVAAWKHAFVEGLLGRPIPDAEEVPPPSDPSGGTSWPLLRLWLDEAGDRLAAALEGLTPAELDREVTVLEWIYPVYRLVSILIEHDHYHAGQINLLRQQQGRSGTDRPPAGQLTCETGPTG